MANLSKISLKLNPDERALLQIGMIQEGWSNMSAYIKTKVFGIDPDKKRDRIIAKKNKEEIAIVLSNHIESLINYYHYVLKAFKKEVSQYSIYYYTELNERLSSIDRHQSLLNRKTKAVLVLFMKIGQTLGIDTSSVLSKSMSNKKSSKDERDIGMIRIMVKGIVTSNLSRCFIKDKVEGVSFTLDTTRKDRYFSEFFCLALPSDIDFEINKGDCLDIDGLLGQRVTKDEEGKDIVKFAILSKYIKKVEITSEERPDTRCENAPPSASP